MGSGSVCEAAVAQPFGYTQREQQASEREAGQSDDEREPASVCTGAGGRKAAEQGLKQQCSEEACADDGCSPLEELAGSVIGLGGHDWTFEKPVLNCEVQQQKQKKKQVLRLAALAQDDSFILALRMTTYQLWARRSIT